MKEQNAKQHIITDIEKAIKILDMLKKSHKEAEMKHFEMVIKDLQRIMKNIETGL